jgi:hypothetical protein
LISGNSNIIYTYPNTSSISQRGGLKSRYLKLKEVNEQLNSPIFQIVEIPADFIKNESEERKTGLSVGSFLDCNAVKEIYTNHHIFNETKYILHTEPIFSRKGAKGRKMPKIQWYNSSWFDKFCKHLFSIIDFFSSTPYAIEIHPGISEKGKNNEKTLSRAIQRLHDTYTDRYGEEVLIFIENRTDQYIQDGSDIQSFWELFSRDYPDLIHKTGIVLDIQQFYTATKKFNKDFRIEFSRIPPDSLIGAHIHERHKAPRCEYIPREIWEFVANEQQWTSQNRAFHILPEVHPHSHVIETYNFCKNFLKI